MDETSPKRVVNKSKIRSLANRAAKAASCAARAERGWVHPEARPRRAAPGTNMFVKDLVNVLQQFKASKFGGK